MFRDATESLSETNCPGTNSSRSSCGASNTKCRTPGAISTHSISFACTRFPFGGLAGTPQQCVDQRRMPVERRRHLFLQARMRSANLLHQARQIALQVHPQREEVGNHNYMLDSLTRKALD